MLKNFIYFVHTFTTGYPIQRQKPTENDLNEEECEILGKNPNVISKMLGRG